MEREVIGRAARGFYGGVRGLGTTLRGERDKDERQARSFGRGPR